MDEPQLLEDAAAYANLKTPPQSNKMRPRMIRPLIGKVKTASSKLPDENFIYGVATTPDHEGAGKVIQRWAQSEPSKPHGSMRSFPATNREALRNGCITARSQRDFCINNPPIFKKSNPKSCHEDDASEDLEQLEQRTFGITSKPNEMSIGELMKWNKIQEESDYPDRTFREQHGKLPEARATNASRLFGKHVKKEYGEQRDKDDLFKMSRFQNVESKVKGMMA